MSLQGMENWCNGGDKMETKQGKCPKCNKDDLDYGSLEIEDDSIYYPYTCNDCGLKGREWYNLYFIGHWDEKGNEL